VQNESDQHKIGEIRGQFSALSQVRPLSLQSSLEAGKEPAAGEQPVLHS
jgi:hypothetical protein